MVLEYNVPMLSLTYSSSNRLYHIYIMSMPSRSVMYILLLCGLFLAACTRAKPELFPPQQDKRPVPVLLLSHGWHVGLLVPVNTTFMDIMPDSLHIESGVHAYAELGWGDERYYMDDSAGIFAALQAALWPTSSVVHIAGFHELPRHTSGQLVRVMLSEAGYAALLRRAARYIKSANALGAGLYGDARFYPSGRAYYFPKTSNRWVAALLEEAGAPIHSFSVLSAGTLMRRSARFGTPMPP